MPTILIIDKTGNITESTVKNFVEDELYKKAGTKTNTGFMQQTEWGIEVNGNKYNIRLYGKTSGQAGQENKYEFPPPIDTTLFFGKCILVNIINEIPLNLSQNEWATIYEELYGGFEDIGADDSESDEESDIELPTTKEGYVKDGFIVDDSAEEEEEEEEEEDEEEEEEEEEDEESDEETKSKATKSKTAQSKQKTAQIKQKTAQSKTAQSKTTQQKTTQSKTTQSKTTQPKTTQIKTRSSKKTAPIEVVNNYLDCKCELEEELYI
jgi:hypothetical protein